MIPQLKDLVQGKEIRNGIAEDIIRRVARIKEPDMRIMDRDKERLSVNQVRIIMDEYLNKMK